MVHPSPGAGAFQPEPFRSLGSRDQPVVNADGSVDLYFGDQAPEGKERNWLRTPKGKGDFAILRSYGGSRTMGVHGSRLIGRLLRPVDASGWCVPGDAAPGPGRS